METYLCQKKHEYGDKSHVTRLRRWLRKGLAKEPNGCAPVSLQPDGEGGRV